MNETAAGSIRKVLRGAATVLVAAALLFGVLLYGRTRAMTLRQIRNNALDIARITAELVDPETFTRLKEGDEKTENYRRVLEALERVRDSSDVEYVYTIRHNAYGITVFCVDADPDEPGKIGEVYYGAPAAQKALAGEPAASDVPYRDRWGTHISAYAPIFQDGSVVGAAVVDLNYNTVRGEVRQVILLVGVLYGAIFLTGLLLMMYVGRQVQKYEYRLRKAREEAEEHERLSATFFAPLASRGESAGASTGAATGSSASTGAATGAGAATGTGATTVTEPVEVTGSDAASGAASGTGEGLRERFAQTEALSYDEAIRLLGNEQLLGQTMRQFYGEIAHEAGEIERLWREGDYENYTIRVHALKSSARMIGATALSGQAGRLEALGNRVTET